MEESAIASFEFCINFPSQFLIDVSDDEAPSRTLASYDRAAPRNVTSANNLARTVTSRNNGRSLVHQGTQSLGSQVGAIYTLGSQATALMQMPTEDGLATAGRPFEYVAPERRAKGRNALEKGASSNNGN